MSLSYCKSKRSMLLDAGFQMHHCSFVYRSIAETHIRSAAAAGADDVVLLN